jgi:hypothetical protein
MGLRLATAVRNSMANVITAHLDADAGAGKLLIYSGSQPANPNAAPTGTLLATFTFADPSFGAAASGTITLDADPVLETVGVAAETAGWCRATDNSGDPVFDGTVSATGGGGTVEINTTAVSVGLTLRITGGTITMPVGA